jgi:hypothetical protein
MHTFWHRYERKTQVTLAAIALGFAALVGGGLLFAAAPSANSVPPFHQFLPLPRGDTLEIGVVPGCPPAMPEMACLHIARSFPPAFRVVYWSAGEKNALVSIALPRH